jgi:hypothetical protein
MSNFKTNVTGAKPIVQGMVSEAQAFSIDAFCQVHCISRALLYNLWADGTGPAFFRVGSKRLISREAAARWRAEREHAAVAAE